MKLFTGISILAFSLIVEGAANPIKDCPDSPNCVSTRALSPKRRIQPIIFNGDKADFKALASSVIESMPRSKIVQADENYIHAEYTSSLFKLVDDFELFYDVDKKMIDMRSSSRTGYYDFGGNLKRSKEFEIEFLNKTKTNNN